MRSRSRTRSWGALQVQRRLRDRRPEEELLVNSGGDSIESAQASISAALRQVLNRAGLSHATGIALKSFRVTYGLRVLEETNRIDSAAGALGMQSLDQAALLLGFNWRPTPVAKDR